MKSRNVKLVSKLRLILNGVLETKVIDPDQLTTLFDEVIVNDRSSKNDAMINGLKATMLNLLAEKILGPDEMQTFVDEAIMFHRTRNGETVTARVKESRTPDDNSKTIN